MELRYLACCCFLFIIGVSKGQDQHSPLRFKEDSLLQLIEETNHDSLRMGWYNQLRRLVIYDDPVKALAYTKEYGHYAQRAKLPAEYAKSKFYEANSYVPTGQYEAALAALLEAERYFREENDSRRLGSCYNSIGAIFEATHRDSLAAVYFQNALEIFSELDDQARQAMALNNLANIALRSDDYTKNIALLRKSIELTKDRDDLNRRMLNLANSFTTIGQLDSAEVVYLNLLKSPQQLNEISKADIHLGLGKLYLKRKDFKRSQQALSLALEKAEQLGIVEQRLEALQHLHLLYVDTNNYPDAHAQLLSYYQLKDSLASSEKDKILVDAITKYETEKKEVEITLLNTQKQAAESIIQQKNRTIWIGSVAASILLALSSFLYWLYRKYRLQKEALTIALQDRENLLQEIHHRVKNNLQIISSLLRLQSRHVAEADAAQALNEGEARVNSMAIIHHHLYTQADHLSQVNVQNYIRDLCHHLAASFDSPSLKVTIRQAVDPIYLDVNTMVPLGLILNELITNAYKYAFKGRSEGQILLCFNSSESGILAIQVKDNGIGKPMDKSMKNGFGSRLISAFLRKLEAEQTITIENGTQIDIVLKIPQK